MLKEKPKQALSWRSMIDVEFQTVPIRNIILLFSQSKLVFVFLWLHLLHEHDSWRSVYQIENPAYQNHPGTSEKISIESENMWKKIMQLIDFRSYNKSKTSLDSNLFPKDSNLAPKKVPKGSQARTRGNQFSYKKKKTESGIRIGTWIPHTNRLKTTRTMGVYTNCVICIHDRGVPGDP